MGIAQNDDSALVSLTPMQMGLLYDSVQQHTPGTHLVQLVCHFDNETPDPQRMAQAWQRLTDRHPLLRSGCNWQNTTRPHLLQIDGIKVHVEVESPQPMVAAAREEWMTRWLDKDRSRGVDINQAPAWRLSMLMWSERAFTLVWTFHHVWLDGPSSARLLQDALLDYLGLAAETVQTSSAPTHADHALAVERWRTASDAVRAAQLFFGQMFQGVSLPVGQSIADALPVARPAPRAAMHSSKGRMGMHAAHLPAGTLAQLDRLGRATNSSLANMVSAAWALVLSRWTGLPDAVFGVVRSGRYLLAGADKTVGCLINTLPIRVPVHRGMSLTELLNRVRAITVGLRPHEHAALHDIRQWCGLDPSANLLGSTVLFEPRPFQSLLADALTTRGRFEVHEQGSSDLALLAYVDSGMDLRLEFDRERVGPDIAQAMLASVRLLLESMAEASPESPLAALRSNTAAQIATLSRWAEPAKPVENVSACVATLFARQARSTPTAKAVSHGAESLSYGQLDEQADRLANWLMAHGVQPGDRVALRLPRSISFVTAMLAVMKSGAAWVPIDPHYPEEVARRMVSDSQAVLLLTNRAELSSARLEKAIALEDVDDNLAPPDAAPLASAYGWSVQRPAYVIYTSGSTGQPKGVVVSHSALASHAEAAMAHYGLHADDRVLQFASLSFDVSIEEIVPTLLAGAELVLRDDSATEAIPDFLHLVQARQITVLNLPTAFWHVLVDQMALLGTNLPASVRLLVVGGERASRGLLEQWSRIQPGLHWINAYGPTETTISCTAFDLPANADLPPGTDVPIGRPFGHARVVLLAVDGSLAPAGARGELCIGGPALADGYYGLEAATTANFIATAGPLDPALTMWGLHRVYCSGDEATWDEQGLLHYLGRRDRQVKVRGFRVELRAIEAAIEQIAGVSQCIAHVDRPGEVQARLLAWVLPQQHRKLLASDIEAALAVSLPAHMRPAVRIVSEWPTTPGGKVDLNRLPHHESRHGSEPDWQAVSAETRKMMQLFSQVLQREAAGPHDSFFDLGGHSLSALSLVAAVNRELGREVTLSMLKAHPTPSTLTNALANNAVADKPKFLVTVEPGEVGIPLYGVHILGHRERFYRPLARRLGPGQAIFGLTTGYTHLNSNALSVEALAELYWDDIQKHQPEGPLVLMAVSMAAYVAFELARLMASKGRPPALLVLIDAAGPEGRPHNRNVLRLMSLHWTRLRSQGLRYPLERVCNRLARGRFKPIAVSLAGRLNIGLNRDPERPEEYDHPADHAFSESLARAVDHYKPRNYEGDMLIYCGDDDPLFDLREAHKNGMGWRPYCSGDIKLMALQSGHVSMLDEPDVRHLALHLERTLRALQEAK